LSDFKGRENSMPSGSVINKIGEDQNTYYSNINPLVAEEEGDSDYDDFASLHTPQSRFQSF